MVPPRSLSFRERNDVTFIPEQIDEQSAAPLPRPKSSRLICFLTYSRVALSTLLCGLVCVVEGLVGSSCEVLLRETCIGMLLIKFGGAVAFVVRTGIGVSLLEFPRRGSLLGPSLAMEGDSSFSKRVLTFSS